METPSIEDQPVRRETLVDRDGLKVVRVTLEPGAGVPEHHSPFDVIVAVVRGGGIFALDGHERDVRVGDIVEMHPRQRHSLRAGEQGMQIVIVHARIAPR